MERERKRERDRERERDRDREREREIDFERVKSHAEHVRWLILTHTTNSILNQTHSISHLVYKWQAVCTNHAV